MFSASNLDLFIVGITGASIGLLGFIVLFNDSKSFTNRALLAFSIITLLWGSSNFSTYQLSSIDSPVFVLWLLRVHIFISVFHAFSFFTLMYFFPKKQVVLPMWYKKILIPWVIIVAIITISPFTFIKLEELTVAGIVPDPVQGPGIAVFGITSFGLVIAGLISLVRKKLNATSVEKRQYNFILLGTLITFIGIISGNLILPLLFDYLGLISLGVIFVLPFVFGVSYAIVKLHLLSVKVIATELLVYIILVVSFFEVLVADSFEKRLFSSIVLIALFSGSILLIKSVRREVKQREQLAVLSKQLQKANVELRKLDRAKSEFISIASHQLRTPMTVIKGFISMSLEGSFGKVPKKLQDPLERAYESNMRLLRLVEDLLSISRIESGKLKYKFVKVHLSDTVSSVVEQLMGAAKKKGLKLTWEKPKKPLPKVTIDELKIRQIIINLIDNAIKYTPKGSIKISVTKEDDNIVFHSKDTGLGMNEDERSGLFEKFRRSKRSTLENTGGSGLGLFVGRMMVTVHGGKIWAESEGHDKGSTFAFSLPLHPGSLPKELKNGDDV